MKTAEYCTQHAPDGMVNVKKIICCSEDCDKSAAFGVEGTKIAEYCRQHALSGMVNVMKKNVVLKAAARLRRSEWEVRKRRSIADSTH